MQAITQSDIESLRRRIHAIEARAPRTDRPPVPEGRDAGAWPANGNSPFGLHGTVRDTPSGQFLLQEHTYPNEALHGSARIDMLQRVSANWLNGISNGEVPPADPRRWAFLDTETTGLAGGTGTCAFLVGIGSIGASGFQVRLFFMRDFDEELAMLQAIAECLASHDVLVTYNGSSFDVPLLETRYRLRRQPNPFQRLGHVDLLHAARRVWSERMRNCKLGTLESEILGVRRSGDVPGALIPQRYFDFLRSGNAAGLREVFHHNVLDIVSLACLSAVLMPAYSDPGKASLHHGQDLLGLARWLRNQGNHESALELYRKAIHAGLPASGLLPSLWESAQIERRLGNHEAQFQLLQDLARVANAYRADAFVELAKHFEHREKDYERALEMTRNAQSHAPSTQLEHRERRLLRKAGRAAMHLAAPSGATNAADSAPGTLA